MDHRTKKRVREKRKKHEKDELYQSHIDYRIEKKGESKKKKKAKNPWRKQDKK